MGRQYISNFSPPRYNWNIVESDVKHHKPKTKTNQAFDVYQYNIFSLQQAMFYHGSVGLLSLL